jgi:hypothetical protein
MASLTGAEFFHSPGYLELNLELNLVAGAVVPENQDLQPFGLDGLLRYRKGKVARKHYVQRVFFDRFVRQGDGGVREGLMKTKLNRANIVNKKQRIGKIPWLKNFI